MVIEIANVAAGISVARVIFPAQTVVQCQPGCDVETVLCVKGPETTPALVILQNVVPVRFVRETQQKVGKIVARKHSMEAEGSVVVSAEET
jgi:hypothetical protein